MPIDAQTAVRLRKVGLSRLAVQALTSAVGPGTTDWKTVLRTGALSPRQVRTLRAGDLSLRALLRGGFTRHQARLIESSTGA